MGSHGSGDFLAIVRDITRAGKEPDRDLKQQYVAAAKIDYQTTIISRRLGPSNLCRLY
jgi:hypothetical protein